jgi:hypothetical protein
VKPGPAPAVPPGEIPEGVVALRSTVPGMCCLASCKMLFLSVVVRQGEDRGD